MKRTLPLTQKRQASSPRFRRFSRQLVDYSFVLPAVLFLVLFVAYPVFFNISMSFQDLKAVNLLTGGDWVGFDNYRAVFANPIFSKAVRNTLYFTLGSVVFQLGLGLALALFYNLRVSR